MPNENLKNALKFANLTIEEFAEIIQVDPKTVQRWVAGRTPYPRYRQQITQALDIPAHQLWPDDIPTPGADDQQPGAQRAVGTATEQPDYDDEQSPYDAPDDGPSTGLAEGVDLLELLDGATDHIDLYDTSYLLLCTPGFPEALREKSLTTNVPIRVFCTADGRSDSLATDPGRVQIRHLPYSFGAYTLFRTDEEIQILLPVIGVQPPVFGITRNTHSYLYDVLTSHIDSMWRQLPAPSPQAAPAPTTWATDLSAASAPSQPRRHWPGRSSQPGDGR